MDIATILAYAMKYGPTVISLIAKYGPTLFELLKNHGPAVAASAQEVDGKYDDPFQLISAFIGQLALRVPAIKALEPAILAQIQANAEEAINLQEAMERQSEG